MKRQYDQSTSKKLLEKLVGNRRGSILKQSDDRSDILGHRRESILKQSDDRSDILGHRRGSILKQSDDRSDIVGLRRGSILKQDRSDRLERIAKLAMKRQDESTRKTLLEKLAEQRREKVLQRHDDRNDNRLEELARLAMKGKDESSTSKRWLEKFALQGRARENDDEDRDETRLTRLKKAMQSKLQKKLAQIHEKEDETSDDEDADESVLDGLSRLSIEEAGKKFTGQKLKKEDKRSQEEMWWQQRQSKVYEKKKKPILDEIIERIHRIQKIDEEHEQSLISTFKESEIEEMLKKEKEKKAWLDSKQLQLLQEKVELLKEHTKGLQEQQDRVEAMLWDENRRHWKEDMERAMNNDEEEEEWEEASVGTTFSRSYPGEMRGRREMPFYREPEAAYDYGRRVSFVEPTSLEERLMWRGKGLGKGRVNLLPVRRRPYIGAESSFESFKSGYDDNFGRSRARYYDQGIPRDGSASSVLSRSNSFVRIPRYSSLADRRGSSVSTSGRGMMCRRSSERFREDGFKQARLTGLRNTKSSPRLRSSISHDPRLSPRLRTSRSSSVGRASSRLSITGRGRPRMGRGY